MLEVEDESVRHGRLSLFVNTKRVTTSALELDPQSVCPARGALGLKESVVL